MINVHFLNKNMFRKYPLKASSSYISNEGKNLPMNLLVGAKFSSDKEHLLLYIKKIFIDDNLINISIYSYDGNVDVPFGWFNGKITSDFENLKLEPAKKYAAGNITIGDKNSLLNFQGNNSFSYANGSFEEALVVPHDLPLVQSIKKGRQTVNGNITIKYENIGQEIEDSKIKLKVASPSLLLSPGDKAIGFGNCGFNVIGSINGVLPDSNGNIDIFGISPVQIQITSTGINIVIPSMTIKDICPNVKNNIPFTPQKDKDIYVDFLTATEEWKDWPQYG